MQTREKLSVEMRGNNPMGEPGVEEPELRPRGLAAGQGRGLRCDCREQGAWAAVQISCRWGGEG